MTDRTTQERFPGVLFCVVCTFIRQVDRALYDSSGVIMHEGIVMCPRCLVVWGRSRCHAPVSLHLTHR